MRDHFRKFAGYNQWVNKRLYDALSQLSEQEMQKDLGAFFGTLTGTLNHLLVGDLLWMQRFDKGGLKPETLDTVLHENFAELRKHREETDERIIRFISGCSNDYLASHMAYRTSAGIDCRDRISDMLTHMFNHQTHHRGQCHHMLSQLGKAPPPLDMIYFIRELE